jgi:hypothetical protein
MIVIAVGFDKIVSHQYSIQNKAKYCTYDQYDIPIDHHIYLSGIHQFVQFFILFN